MAKGSTYIENQTNYISGNLIIGREDAPSATEEKAPSEEVVEDDGTEDAPSIPQSLSSEDVTGFFEKLKWDGILDENLQPKVSNRKASILADYVGTRFNVRAKWKDFAELWGMDKEVLRSTFNNITDSEEDKAFCKRLNRL